MARHPRPIHLVAAGFGLLLIGSPLVPAAVGARPAGGGFGGRYSGAGVRPGAGFGAPGAGLGGVGGPASGAGVRPGAGWGAPGAGLYRGVGAPGAARWNNGWRAGGYWGARPWTGSWYRVYPAGWGWWGASAAAWGVTSLATAATVTALVNAAADQQSTVIVVPDTSYQLDYGSLQAVQPAGATFSYAPALGLPYQVAQVECRQGLFNGMPPQTVQQAQLLSAACQVAYGSV